MSLDPRLGAQSSSGRKGTATGGVKAACRKTLQALTGLRQMVAALTTVRSSLVAYQAQLQQRSANHDRNSAK
jgi:hypothetical protein